MLNKLFIVVAGSKSAEQCYSSIIHSEYPFSYCITTSELLNEYGGDSSSLGEYIKTLLTEPKLLTISQFYFLVFPPDGIISDDEFWLKPDIIRSQLEGFRRFDFCNVSVWSADFRCIPESFLPYLRSYDNQEGLENGLREFIRAQKHYNPKDVMTTPSGLFDNITREKVLFYYNNLEQQGVVSQENDNINIFLVINPETNIILERKQYIMSEIRIFSSSEADSYVKELSISLNDAIQNHGLFYQCGTWRNPVTFGNGGDTITALIDYAKGLKKKKGYAVFFFAPDDDAVIRREEYYIARDNDWLELGLFSAILDPSHVFAIFPKSPVTKHGVEKKWHHPTDFVIQHRTYEFKDNPSEAQVSLKLVAVEIAAIIHDQNRNESGSQVKQSLPTPPAFNPKSI